jgi:hypothetical protein
MTEPIIELEKMNKKVEKYLKMTELKTLKDIENAIDVKKSIAINTIMSHLQEKK